MEKVADAISAISDSESSRSGDKEEMKSEEAAPLEGDKVPSIIASNEDLSAGHIQKPGEYNPEVTWDNKYPEAEITPLNYHQLLYWSMT